MKSLERYARTIGSKPLQAFMAADTIESAVRVFFSVSADGHAPGDQPGGCLLGCVAAQCAETMPDVRQFYHGGLAAIETALAGRFEDAVAEGKLPGEFPSEERARLMVDLMQGYAAHARTGSSAADRRAFVQRSVEATLN